VSFIENGTRKKVFKISGHWNSKVFIQDLRIKDAEPELAWQKTPLPEKWRFMFGYSHFTLQLNYFPKWLQSVVAPTDSRRRTDQRALENGDMRMSGAEKDRLEIKQRFIAKTRNQLKLAYKPVFFEHWVNPIDRELYYVYNFTYFEHCRKNQDWSDLGDIFSEKMPTREEIKKFSMPIVE